MSSVRSGVVAELRNRVVSNLSNTIEDRDCVAVCIAASFPRDRDELFGVLLNNNISRLALKCTEQLAIRDEEWRLLLGKDAVLNGESHAALVTHNESFSRHETAISTALRCSLTEQASKHAWKRASSRLSCFVALYTDSSEEFISHVLGGLVRADTRRLEDVRSSLEDEATDHLLLCQAVVALSNSVA